MIARTTGDDIETPFHKCFSEGVRIANDLEITVSKEWCECFPESDGDRECLMIVWTTLESWKNRSIDLLRKIILFCETSFCYHNHRSSRTTQSLMGRRGNNMSIRCWAYMCSRDDKARYMWYISSKICTYRICYTSEFYKWEFSRIGCRSYPYKLRTMLSYEFFYCFKIDISIGSESVENRWKILSRCTRLPAMGQVSSLCKTHTHSDISGITECIVDSEIGRTSWIGLYIHMYDSGKCLFCTSNREIFYHIDYFIPSIIPFSWVSLRILIREWRSEGFDNWEARDALARDEFEARFLSLDFFHEKHERFRIGDFEMVEIHSEMGKKIKNYPSYLWYKEMSLKIIHSNKIERYSGRSIPVKRNNTILGEEYSSMGASITGKRRKIDWENFLLFLVFYLCFSRLYSPFSPLRILPLKSASVSSRDVFSIHRVRSFWASSSCRSNFLS